MWAHKNNQTTELGIVNARIKKYSIIYKNFLGITLEELLIKYKDKLDKAGIEMIVTSENPGGPNKS
jgi:hypothetical protein